jgi:hypothetical protein
MNKLATFAPATTQTFIEILTSTDDDLSRPFLRRNENLFSNKLQKKLVRFKNECYICTPLNDESLRQKK